MNQDMSLWSLIANASIVVQLVMLTLFLASVVSWGMIIQRALLLSRAKKQFLAFEQTFWSGIDLGQLYRCLLSASADASESVGLVLPGGPRVYYNQQCASRLAHCTL